MFWSGFYGLATIIGAWILWLIIGAFAVALIIGLLVVGAKAIESVLTTVKRCQARL